MPVPDYSDPTPAKRQIAEDIREQIRAGAYAPASRLPSNLALAKQYGVAPETIRSALDELRDEGIVATQSTRGTFVVSRPAAGVQPDFKAVVEELAELRQKLAERVDADDDLNARVGKLEADVLALYNMFAFEYDQSGEHDDAGEAPRRGQARP